ncbi:MAG: hypothetical protein RR295_00640 [Oscillospiraceae bacterium]
MKADDTLILDDRGAEELRAEIATLAASYTPEWRFDPARPDAGTTLALIFANQMAENIGRMNRLPQKYHTEFENILGLSLLPAYPASGIVVASPASDTIPGVALAHGSKLLGQAEGGEPVVFETAHDVYVTSARLTDLLSISPERGKILPLLNGPPPVQLFARPLRAEEESTPAETVPPPFSLFDFDGAGMEKNALLLYHKSILDVDGGVRLRIQPIAPDGSSLAAAFADPTRYRWSRSGGDGAIPMDTVELEGDAVLLTQSEKSIPVTLDGTEFCALCIEALKPIAQPVILRDLRLSAVYPDTPPEFVLHNNEELSAAEFLPFGDSASLFDECFIGHDRLFAQQGAQLHLRFHLGTQEKRISLTALQEEATLKVIKRKPSAIQFDTATTSPQRVGVEYYNGLGWKRLDMDVASLFDGTHAGDFDLTFLCPEDWQATTAGGFHARMLRLAITRADNCYLRPCMHTMPVITGLQLACSYENRQKQPQRLWAVRGACTMELSEKLYAGQPFAAFSPLPYGCDALYLGFDAAPEDGPTSLLFDAAESALPDDFPPNLEYSARDGQFHPLRVIDGTKNLTRAGTIAFLPPGDFAPIPVEGVERFWLRLVDRGEGERFHPRIRRLLLNAVEVRNQETRTEESFFIDVASPYMRFPLAADHIYAVRVYVSELPKYAPSTMEQMARQMPERVRISYDSLGTIRSFFVLWDEVENFAHSTPGDRHYVIDRMKNTISFGDGVHVQIPPAQKGVAFTAQAICCSGSAGNLPAGAVNTGFDSALYLGELYNPVPTFGGSDLETIADAERRGAAIVCGRNRLVSEEDYVREVQAFSESIEKVRCVAGRDIWGGEAPGLITIAILSRAYENGAYAFAGLHDALQTRLLSRSEATVTEEVLCLCEPAYVKISVDVWAQVHSAAHSFDIQTLITDSIAAFLSPIGTEGRAGWDIGSLPTEEQLRQMLQALHFDGWVEGCIATARYVDAAGAHETDLAHLPPNPFAIAVGGSHHVFLELGNH